MNAARVAVVQFPGVNCESETVRALERAGLDAEVFRWTRPARELEAFDAYVLPGGFSYQDRVRAGVLAAMDPLVDVLAGRAEDGRPILGICNGAQVLVEAGLVPGGDGVGLALARNRMPSRGGYYTRWVTCRVEVSPCVFTRHLEPGTLLPLPVAHGEGRFVASRRGTMAKLAASGRVPLRYARLDGGPADAFPDNPNGAEESAAAVCDARGTVLAMMPHPERVLDLGAISRRVGGAWGRLQREALAHGGAVALADAPGTEIFTGLAAHLEHA